MNKRQRKKRAKQIRLREQQLTAQKEFIQRMQAKYLPTLVDMIFQPAPLTLRMLRQLNERLYA